MNDLHKTEYLQNQNSYKESILQATKSILHAQAVREGFNEDDQGVDSQRCLCNGTRDNLTSHLVSSLLDAIEKQKRGDMISDKKTARERYFRVGDNAYNLVERLRVLNRDELSGDSQLQSEYINAARKISNGQKAFERFNEESLERFLMNSHTVHLQPFIRENYDDIELLFNAYKSDVRHAISMIKMKNIMPKHIRKNMKGVKESLGTLKLTDQQINESKAHKRYKMYLKRVNNLLDEMTYFGYVSESTPNASENEYTRIPAFTAVEHLQTKHTAFITAIRRLRQESSRRI